MFSSSSENSMYASYHEFSLTPNDTRITRNFEELITERGQDDKIYNSVFEKIKEKLFISSESDDIELTELDKLTFNKKYNVTESQNVISKLKLEIAKLYIKQTEHELIIQEKRKLFETFCLNISNTIKSISDITYNESTEEDVKLQTLLNERIDWYYKSLNLEKLIDEEYSIKSEFYYLKTTLIELSALQSPILCSICMENQISWFIDPCGHTLCDGCKTKSMNLDRCHYCRSTRTKFNRLYI
jgi:hypothetical protein